MYFEPLVYEGFLPVSAATIFKSNLGVDTQVSYATTSNQQAFQVALGAMVQTLSRSLTDCARVGIRFAGLSAAG